MTFFCTRRWPAWLTMLAHLLGDWSSQSTCHGLRNIFNVQSGLIRRFFWISTLGAVIFGLYFGYDLQITRYKKFRTITKETIRYEDNLDFPAITICSLCTIRNDSISNPLDKKFINDFFNPQTPNISLLVDEYGEDYLKNFSISDIFTKGSVPAEDMFRKCYWENVEINCTKDLTARRFTTGLCYTFNQHQNPRYVTSSVGSIHGLSLILYANQDNYFSGDRASAGFKVLVHDPKVQPDMTLSTSLSPGFSYFIAVSKHEHRLLPAPVKAFGEHECLKNVTANFSLTNFHHYSIHSCELECMTNHIYKRCGCINPIRTDHSDNRSTIRECNPIESLQCSYPLCDRFFKRYKWFMNHCGCALPCDSISYDTSMSFAYFPNYNFLKQNVDLFSGPEQDIDYVRANYLSVQIYFNSKIVRTSEQILEFPLEDLLTSIAGYLSLAVGASVITLLEILELLLILVYKPWIKR